MYQMLIVEDEYWIRKSICNEIKKHFVENVQILEAEDGEQALEILKMDPVSFLLTDINMPFMDGLELISNVVRKYPDMPIMVLSGYSDFQLVREALTGGAMDYLLKPVKEEALCAAVDKMMACVEQKHQEKESAQEAQMQEQIYRNYIKDLTISSFICQKNPDGFIYSKKAMQDFCSELHFPVYMAVIQRKGARKTGDVQESVLESRFEKKKRLEEWLGEDALFGIENAYRSEEYLVFANGDKKDLQGKCMELRERYKDQPYSCYICVSECLKTVEEIPRAYKECMLKIISNAQYGSGFQYMMLEWPDCPIDPKHEISEKLEESILQAFRENNKKQLTKLVFEQLGIGCFASEKWQLLEVKQIFSRLQSLIHMFYQRKLSMDEMWEVDNLFDSIELAVSGGETEEILGVTSQLISMLISEKTEENEPEFYPKDTVGQIMEYVRLHCEENLSLSFLAKEFYLTPSYLSRSFKKQTGKNLVAYITEQRLEKAVEYIKEGKKTLTEVAFLVGYDDYTYFNKVFRRYLGVSPMQYRERLEKGKNFTSDETKKS